MTVLFAFFHHLAAFSLVAALAIELVLIRQELTLANARKLIAIDTALGAAATILLVVGLMRVFYFEKGPDYYWHSHAFLTKFTAFIAAALLSVIPTFEFRSWRKAIAAGQVPAVKPERLVFLRKVIHGELLAVVIILFCAALMAKGRWM